jgi:hypothetical protein
MEEIIPDILVLILNRLRGYDVYRFSLTSKFILRYVNQIMHLLDIDLSKGYVSQKSINFFKSCKSLNVSKCKSDGVDIDEFTELISLNISATQDTYDKVLHIINLYYLFKLPKLSILNVSETGITYKHIEVLPKTLISLNLRNCPISYSSVKYLAKLTNLQELNLSGSTIINFEEILFLTNLRKLYLSKVSFLSSSSYQDLQCLSVLSKLKLLSIEEDNQKYLNGLTQANLELEEFYLNTRDTEYIDVTKFKQLTKLSIIYNGKILKWIFNKEIFNLKSLTYLGLSGVTFNDEYSDVLTTNKLEKVKLLRCKGLRNVIKLFENVDILRINACYGLNNHHLEHLSKISNISFKSFRLKDMKLSYLENVVILSVDDFRDTEIILISRLRNLQSLKLNWNTYSHKTDEPIVIDELLKHISNLYYLYIRNVIIQDFNLSTLQSLVKFGLRQCSVKEENFLSLSELKYLTSIIIDHDSTPESVIGKLEEKRSDISIDYIVII